MVSKHTAHQSLLHMGLYSPINGQNIHGDHYSPTQKHLQWPCEYQNWIMEQWNKVAWSDGSFFYIMEAASCVCSAYHDTVLWLIGIKTILNCEKKIYLMTSTLILTSGQECESLLLCSRLASKE